MMTHITVSNAGNSGIDGVGSRLLVGSLVGAVVGVEVGSAVGLAEGSVV